MCCFLFWPNSKQIDQSFIHIIYRTGDVCLEIPRFTWVFRSLPVLNAYPISSHETIDVMSHPVICVVLINTCWLVPNTSVVGTKNDICIFILDLTVSNFLSIKNNFFVFEIPLTWLGNDNAVIGSTKHKLAL